MGVIRYLMKTSYLQKLFATNFDIKTHSILLDLPRCSIFRRGRLEAALYAYQRGATSGRIRFRRVAATQLPCTSGVVVHPPLRNNKCIVRLHSARTISALWSERDVVGKCSRGARKAEAISRAVGLHDNTEPCRRATS